MTRRALLQEHAKLVAAIAAAVLAAMLAISNYGDRPAQAEAASGCDDGPWGPGNWPPACYRPYADTSPYNTLLPANPQLVSNSEQISDRIFTVRDGANQGIARIARPNHITANPAGTGGEPTYYSRSSDPDFVLHCEGDIWGRPDGKCPIEGVKINIPAGAKVEAGPDHHLTVVDQVKDKEFDLYGVHSVKKAGTADKKPMEEFPGGLPAAGGNLYAWWGGRIDPHGLGLLDQNDKPYGEVGDTTAAHVGNLAGRLRAEELAAGQINHALAIVVDCVDDSPVYPASANGDGQQCDELGLSNDDAPSLGTRLRLNMSAADINNLTIDPWKKTVLHALRKYGAFIDDTGAEGYFAIEAEAGVQYQVTGDNDKWYAFGKNNWELYTGNGTTDYVAKLYNDGNDPKSGQPGYVNWESRVWENMEVVEPEVSRDKIAPTVTRVAPSSGSTGVSPTKNVSALFSEAMQKSTVNGATFRLKKQGATTQVPASVSYDAATRRATLNPSRDLRLGATYVATVAGGSTGVKDLSENHLANDKVWRFTVRR